MRGESLARPRAVAVWARPMPCSLWLVEYRFGPGSADKAPTRTRCRQDCDSGPRPRHVKRAAGRG